MKYNALNQLTEAVMPDGSALRYSYDKGGLLNKIAKQETEYITNITYNSKGQRENIYYGNNTKTRYDYHPQNFRLIRLVTSRNTGQDILQDLNYEYDSVGNITQIRDAAQQTEYVSNQAIAPVMQYTYDTLYRLLTATGRELAGIGMPSDKDYPYSQQTPGNTVQNYHYTYSYDALGNMISDPWKTNIYNEVDNKLIRHNEQTVSQYSYDAHGNMLTMPHLSSMHWDYKDQLIGASNSTFTSYYSYDIEGKRTRKTVVKDNITETRYYVNGFEVYRKEGSSDDYERSTLNISDDEKVFARIESKDDENPVIRYQYDNHLGSACLELSYSGDIISYEEYYPFGQTSYYTSSTNIEISLKRYKYCGKEKDEETGLYYYGMRYYSDWLCRFVSVDPLQFKYPELTPFQYASNNPVTMIDLDGAEGVDPQEQHTFYSDPTKKDLPVTYSNFENSILRSNLIIEDIGGREKTLEILKTAFGTHGENFSFNNDNQLIYAGNPDSLSDSERIVFDGLSKIMKDPQLTKIIFEKNSLTESHGGEAVKTIADNAGQKENIIYVDPVDIYKKQIGTNKETEYFTKNGISTTTVIELAQVDEYGRPQRTGKLIETPIYAKDSVAARFFHGVGHVLYPRNNEHENVIHYDNAARNIFKVLKNGVFKKSTESQREIDDAHRNRP